jgi:hypothetical protein
MCPATRDDDIAQDDFQGHYTTACQRNLARRIVRMSRRWRGGARHASVRASLAMPACSVSTERLLSDADNKVEGAMRRNQSSAMLSTGSRSCGCRVRAELHGYDRDASCLANTTEMFTKLVKSVCSKVMERVD